jgi:hypothetical protein
VPLYIVERNPPRLTVNGLIVAQLSLVQASRRLAAAGEEIRYLRSTFIPRTSQSFCVFEAPGPDLVRRLNDAAAFAFSSIEEAVDLPAPDWDQLRPTRERR